MQTIWYQTCFGAALGIVFCGRASIRLGLFESHLESAPHPVAARLTASQILEELDRDGKSQIEDSLDSNCQRGVRFSRNFGSRREE